MNDTSALFPGFEAKWLDGDEGRIFARVGGSGPALVLIHGFPQTHAMWHRIAPQLAQTHTVICPDLRGYGWSSAPPSQGGARYAKREMGKDIVAIMEQLGHVTFAVAGHDRGARVAYRLALDHPGRLTRLALLDILPTFFVWQQIKAGAMPGAHWTFLAGEKPGPEREIGLDPAAYFEGLMARWTASASLDAFSSGALASYRASCNDPTRIHAMCEDYRAGATLDLDADLADLKTGKVVGCPTLLVWGNFYLTGKDVNPLDVWRGSFAPDAVGTQVSGGHFVAEEDAPGTLAALRGLLA
jgi:haloacetate dehalogenase